MKPQLILETTKWIIFDRTEKHEVLPRSDDRLEQTLYVEC